jgi:hypothetical protein
MEDRMANYCFVAPILPGGEQKVMDFIENKIHNNPNHDRVFSEAGISREQLWIQRTPMGDFAVVSFEAKDPGMAFQKIMTSTDPWAADFRAHLQSAHGFDLSQPVPLNEQVLDWNVTERMKAVNK